MSATPEERIWAAFGFTPEEAAEIKASPENQAYERARAAADAATEEFIAYARGVAERASARLNAQLLDLDPLCRPAARWVRFEVIDATEDKEGRDVP